MARRSPYDLNYGHFGQAIYSIENGAWAFDRKPGHREALHNLGSWKEVRGHAQQPDDSDCHDDPIRVNEVRHAAKLLCRDHRELLPALDILPELALASAAVKSTASTYDPAVGDLLSFGSFTAAEGNPRPGRRIVALPTEEAGNVLLLMSFVKERQGWAQDRSVWLDIPAFSDSDQAYWAEEASPIQQVCFAQSEARSAFLAVRFPTKTVLFRPLRHHRRHPANRSRFYHLPASPIDPNPILTVSSEQTGGASHADVTFNPDYQRQFGIVDVKGKWSVWDIDGGQRGSKYSITCMAMGLVSQDANDQVDEDRPREDGWARMLWIGDVNTILVCNRRQLQCYGLKGGETVPLRTFQPVQQHSADWILDIKRHDTNARRFFVLTSTHLYLLAVICQNDVLGSSDLVPGVAVVLSWVHFRGLEDITLQLHVPTLSHEETSVFLYSRLNSLITVYHFRTTETEPPRPFSSSDPMRFSLDDLLNPLQEAQHVIGLHLEPLGIREAEQRLETGPGPTYFARDVQFYHLTVMLSDRSVHQAVFYSSPHTTNLDSEGPLLVEPPTWTATIQRRAPGLHSGKDSEHDEGFILQNGMDELGPSLRPAYRNRSTSASGRRSFSDRSDQVAEIDTANFTTIYDSLSRGVLVETGDDKPEVEDVSAIIVRADDTLQKTESNMAPGSTLMELSKAPITASDVDKSSAQLQNLFMRHSPHSLEQIVSQQTLSWANHEDALPNMSSLYDVLLETWISPLPTSAPNRFRQSKEIVARRVAAEVTLASSRIRGSATFEMTQSYPEPVVSSQSQPSLTIPSSMPSSPPRIDSFPAQRSMSTPLLSSQPEPSSGPLPTHPDPVSRLNQHLRITKPPPRISPNIKQVLMHWTPAADPSTYDWATTTRAVDEELGITEDTEDVSQKQKERLKRKAERLLKRQKRELDLGRSIRNAESQHVLALRSSPVPMVGMTASSQTPFVGMSSQTQAASQSQSQPDSRGFAPFGFGVVQSQVEPGNHGGRAAIKKKKKKGKGKGRISGF